MKISVSELEQLVFKALKNYGYSDDEADHIAEVLMYAQLRGNNQGIVKLIGKGLPKSDKAGDIGLEKETELSALLDGNHNMGMVVINQAVEMAIKKAKDKGFGIVGTFNTTSSTGAIGYYANKIAKEGLIGYVFAGSPETVTTEGSYEPLFGTNPIAIGVPRAGGDPVVLDMATSAIAYYGLIQANTAGEKIPGDVAYDNTGKLTTDPAEAMKGAILPFDRSYKGAGLSLMVEIMTGPLVAASYIGFNEEGGWGNLVYAMDPGLLVDAKKFAGQVDELARRVKAAKKQEGVEEIWLPGERGNAETKKVLDEGKIEVEDNLLQGLQEAAGNN